MTPVVYLDACPSCPPGIPDASPATGPALDVNGGTVTDHQCGLCGIAWSTLWWAGWPVEQTVASVADALQERRNAA